MEEHTRECVVRHLTVRDQLVRAGDPELDVWWMNRASNMVTFSSPSAQLMDLFQVSHVASPEPLPDLVAVKAEMVNEGCETADDEGDCRAGGDAEGEDHRGMRTNRRSPPSGAAVTSA